MLLILSGVEYKDDFFYVVQNKFLNNFISMPLLIITFISGVCFILYAMYITLFKDSDKGIWFAGIGTVLTVTTIISLIGFNNTAIYPSLVDINSSLTIENSSGSLYTLEVMSYVSLGVPVVLGYIFYLWRIMDTNKITKDEILSDSHHY